MSLFDSTHTVCTDCFNSEEHIFQKHTLWQLFKEGQKLCRKWLGENTVGTLRTHCHIWMLCCWVVLLKKTKSSFLIIKVIRNVCLSFISFWMQNVCLFFLRYLLAFVSACSSPAPNSIDRDNCYRGGWPAPHHCQTRPPSSCFILLLNL